jgi:hypothetical protein
MRILPVYRFFPAGYRGRQLDVFIIVGYLLSGAARSLRSVGLKSRDAHPCAYVQVLPKSDRLVIAKILIQHSGSVHLAPDLLGQVGALCRLSAQRFALSVAPSPRGGRDG